MAALCESAICEKYNETRLFERVHMRGKEKLWKERSKNSEGAGMKEDSRYEGAGMKEDSRYVGVGIKEDSRCEGAGMKEYSRYEDARSRIEFFLGLESFDVALLAYIDKLVSDLWRRLYVIEITLTESDSPPSTSANIYGIIHDFLR